jgi:hypothetical protein
MNIQKSVLTLISILICTAISTSSQAQRFNLIDSTIKLSMIDFHYAILAPGGDLKDRFGITTDVGLGFLRKTKRNFLWGADVNYLSGSEVKEKYILDGVRTNRNQFININGNFADVRLFERGFSSYAKIGKLIPVSKQNKNSGILLMFGLGFLQHKIHIEVLEENVPALNDQQKKGYDRLTNGLSFKQSIGYFYLHPRFLYNFYASFDFSQSLTQDRRDWDIYAQRKLDDKRNDFLNGVKVGVIFPLYRRMPKEYYFR